MQKMTRDSTIVWKKKNMCPKRISDCQVIILFLLLVYSFFFNLLVSCPVTFRPEPEDVQISQFLTESTSYILLLVARGIATRSKKLLVAPGIASSR